MARLWPGGPWHGHGPAMVGPWPDHVRVLPSRTSQIGRCVSQTGWGVCWLSQSCVTYWAGHFGVLPFYHNRVVRRTLGAACWGPPPPACVTNRAVRRKLDFWGSPPACVINRAGCRTLGEVCWVLPVDRCVLGRAGFFTSRAPKTKSSTPSRYSERGVG